jgi:membrane-bound metal-dependent hydrolase YbcI (DUF457 family)
MLRRTHLVFSIFVFLILFSYLDFLNRWIFFIFLLIGTLIVDIDSRKSKLGKRWYLRPIQWFVSHRGAFHTLLFGLFLGILVYFFNHDAGFGFFVGYFLHLFLDLFNVSGLRMFRPVSRRKISFGIRTGGMVEDIIFVVLLFVDAVLVWKIILH